MKKLNSNGFTLIELLIVISIIGILTVLLIVPYNLYNNISRVRVSKEIISQTISEARNSSAGLINSTGKNQNIGIFFTKGGNSIKLIGFPYDYTGLIQEGNGTLIREIPLEKDINTNKFLDNLGSVFSLSPILYFKSPNGEMEIYKNPTETGILKNIIVGFRSSESGILSKNIEIK